MVPLSYRARQVRGHEETKDRERGRQGTEEAYIRQTPSRKMLTGSTGHTDSGLNDGRRSLLRRGGERDGQISILPPIEFGHVLPVETLVDEPLEIAERSEEMDRALGLQGISRRVRSTDNERVERVPT